MRGVDSHVLGAGLGGLGSIFGGDIQGTDAAFCCSQCHGQHAGYRAQGAVQSQLTQKGGVCRDLFQLAAGGQQRQKQRQIVHRPCFADVGGSQIHRDAPIRKPEAKVLDSSAHTVGAFAHGRIRQAYDGKSGQTARDIGLHRHGKTAQAVQAETSGHRIHDALPLSGRSYAGDQSEKSGKYWKLILGFDKKRSLDLL